MRKTGLIYELFILMIPLRTKLLVMLVRWTTMSNASIYSQIPTGQEALSVVIRNAKAEISYTQQAIY